LTVQATASYSRGDMTAPSDGQAYPPIADYGLIGDMHSCALVSRAGSVDWCCFPRFDSPSVFGRILDWRKGGHFLLAPSSIRSIRRGYLPETNILETMFETDDGSATLTDFMPVHPHARPEQPREVSSRQQIVRKLECTSGSVDFVMQCQPRFDYGSVVPHAQLDGYHAGFAHGGGDGISLYSSGGMRIEEDGFTSAGRLQAGEKVWACVTYRSRFTHKVKKPHEAELELSLVETIAFWRKWAALCTYEGAYREDILRSALTLKALTYAPSGALVAAATTSLPEDIGGERNWDYRYTWIRDTSFAIYALSILGYQEEAAAFKDWLEWSTVGRARDLQVMYGVGGERRLTEIRLAELEGYRGSQPVRIGNGAHRQLQLDVYGELLDAAHLYRKFVGSFEMQYWDYCRRLVEFVIDHWREPDEGIWETRGAPQHFVFSKVLCWVALDRAIKAARALNLPSNPDRWRAVRAEIKEDILHKGFDADRGTFLQAYGSKNLDAATLALPLFGFIKADDSRMRSTIEAIERELTSPEGFVYRYRNFDDGLSGDEGAFTICTYWLADNFIYLGEIDRARALFEKLKGYTNDLGLLSEQIDGKSGEMLGNFPQAFSHMALINTAVLLERAERRRGAMASEAAQAQTASAEGAE
jgi:GH15 family glucan-1,4-alpha-glucosidase